MTTANSVPVQEGQVLAGKYRVERVIGAGGMGVVVQATHLQLDQRVAIKFLLPTAAANPEVVARFAREARAAAKVQGEHIVRVMDVSQLEDGTPYMVMEYLEGSDLAHEIEHQGPLPVTRAVGWVLEACEAIADAHAAGIVHRDLKPANLFLSRRRDGGTTVKVLDFGISKTLPTGRESGSEMSLTTTSAVMGSPLYMSPEQMRSSRNVDARADIWAIGVILYEALAGHVPFMAEAMPELCAKVLMEEPLPIASARTDVPAQVVAAIETCLKKNPAERFPNVAELAAALAPFGPPSAATSAERARATLVAAGMPVRAAPEPVGPALAAAVSEPRAGSTGVAWGTVTQRGSRARPALIAGVSIGAALLIAVPLAFVLRGRPDASQPATPLVSSASEAPLPSIEADPTASVVPSSARSAAPDDSASAPVQPLGVARTDDRTPQRTPKPSASSTATSAPPGTTPAATSPTAQATATPTATPTAPPPVTTSTGKLNINLK